MFSAEKQLKEKITSCRKAGFKGEPVVYDLTRITGKYKEKVYARTLASVFFELDVSKWFDQKSNKLLFKPDYSAEFIVSDSAGLPMEPVMEKFVEYLCDDQIRINYSSYILWSARSSKVDPSEIIPGAEPEDYIADRNRLERMQKVLKTLLDQVKGNFTIKYS